MGSSRSKEDEVQRISTSVFVTNFPEVFSAKDLWNTCKQYGQVVDAYIPNKRSKAGKRFGFVRFVKVFDTERLVNNLCTVWVGRHKLHANIPRFQREPLNKHSNHHNNFGEKRGSSGNNKNGGLSNPKGFMVFDQCDYSLSLTGKVLDFGSLSNLKMVLTKEGFENFNLKYGVGFPVSWMTKEGDESDEDTFDDEFGKDNSKANMNFNLEEVDKVDKLNGKEQGYIQNANEQVNIVEEKSNQDMSSLKEEDKESRCSGHFRCVEGPRNSGTI
ncbi:nucleotide-binding alpha-beta plait domain-containing protein [Tanacetum coccineum]